MSMTAAHLARALRLSLERATGLPLLLQVKLLNHALQIVGRRGILPLKSTTVPRMTYSETGKTVLQEKEPAEFRLLLCTNRRSWSILTNFNPAKPVKSVKQSKGILEWDAPLNGNHADLKTRT